MKTKKLILEDMTDAEIEKNWTLIVSAMDDDIREQIHAEGIDNQREFLERYFALSPHDLVE